MRITARARRWAAVAALAAGTAAGIALVAGPAGATPAVHAAKAAPLIGQYKLCLKSDHSLCLKGNGQGVQATVVHSGYSTFNTSFIGGGTAFQDQHGNYLRGQNSGNVAVGTTCTPADTSCQWDQISQGGVLTYRNRGQGGFMGTNSDTNGAGVNISTESWLMTILAS